MLEVGTTSSRADSDVDSSEDPKDAIKVLDRKRATHKTRITLYINQIASQQASGELTATLCKAMSADVDNELRAISDLDEQINTIIDDNDLSSCDAEFCKEELANQAKHLMLTRKRMDQFADVLSPPPSGGASAADKMLDLMAKMNVSEGKPPPLECGTFNGKEKDKFAFNAFLNQFNNVIGSRKHLSDAVKQTYLYGYLRDYALSIVKPLAISDSNYKVAISMLKQEFLDVNYIVDETFKNLLQASPNQEFDPEYTSVKVYLNEIRAYLYELKSHKVDLLESGTAGHKFISHVVFSKLPAPVRREFVHKFSNNYPSLNDVLDKYTDVLQTLYLTSSVKKKPFVKPSGKQNNSPGKLEPKGKSPKEDKRALQNYKVVNVDRNVKCKLCNSKEHTLGKCPSFTTFKARIDRANELSLCTRCAGSGHKEASCYGAQNKLRFECFHCKRREHITPLCPKASPPASNVKTNLNLCFAQRNFDSSQLMGTMTLQLKNGKMRRKVRCLIDTGSQRSYLSEHAAKDLCHDVDELYALEMDVSTYIGEGTRQFKQMSTGVRINGQLNFVPLLIDRTLDIEYEAPGLTHVVNKFKRNNIQLLDEAFISNANHDTVKVDMLMGIDIIQLLIPSQYKEMLGGTCFVFNNKVAPVGNVFDFLTPAQEKEIRASIMQTTKTCHEDAKTRTVVNLVMDPLKSYFNPLETILEDSEVDNGLEYLFSLESLGIKKDDKELVSFDQEQIDKFKEGISFDDGHYNIELPWYPDKVDKVPSNHFVALKVLDRTLQHLERKGLTSQYEEVFDKQLAEGIIEEINVNPSDYENHVWIPHRPVIKEGEQVTTKIRPVFNCSLKTRKDLPSLNEAAYPGIDMIGSILKLLMYFRTNKFVMLSDIKQAFLMVNLKTEADKNRFCFFWKRGDKLVAYRYKTIVFGYTASPFILNYVMRHHVESFPEDKCKEILSNNFYVDNLLITGNNVEEMKDLYNQSYERMKRGGFLLRSWNSNSIELKDQMKADQRLVEHSCEQERVLGYKYNVTRDTLSVAHCNLVPSADTKRKVLSQTSKVYDPLNLTLPVTVRGRVLMRKIWKLEAGWDDKLPKDICNEMKNLTRDLEMLSTLEFPRFALNEGGSYGLHIFTDSSVEAYGFVAYAVNENNESSYLFSKSKLAPLSKRNEHSVPTLELMGVILAYKCLPTLLDAYSNIQFQFINISVDAQVVLNWLITKETKVKGKFVRNRVLETDCLREDISRKYKLPVVYHYVNTSENPADLVTRGLTYSKFLEKLPLWLKGPSWLTNNFDDWPSFPMLSVSEGCKQRVNTACHLQVNKVNTGILNLNKYSNFNTLMKVTSNMFKWLSKIKDCDPMSKAIDYWVKTAQAECFAAEIKFLTENTVSNDTRDSNVPHLVMNLNLYVDQNGILRSRGRISKCRYFNKNVHNPILLPKAHHLTTLIIRYCHSKVQHLGIGTTLNYLREQGYWIPKGRAAIKSVLSECITCKKFNALAYKYPKFTDMPKHHMNLVKPFQHVGVDYTGHFWVKDEISGKSNKMFILVFTCLNIRAVHFELLPDMSTKNFILAFQRFCNTYAIPQYLYSDNGKQFIKGGSILENSLQSKEVLEELANCNVKHVRIPLYSAWIGSAWERLIRVLKNCLYKVVGRAKLSYFELLTTLSNIQLAVNSRPLTYRASTESLEFITPNSFIRLHGNSSLILRSDDNDLWVDDNSQPNLERTVEMQEELIENFKKLWYESYLLSLREHSRNLYCSNWEDRIKVGDIVLIKAFNKPRPFWMMGKVLELIIGYDGKVRSVKLKQGNGSVEHHSINNLYPLELSVTHAVNDNAAEHATSNNDIEASNVEPEEIIAATPDVMQATVEPPKVKSVRPKRKATERFHKMMKENLGYL